MNGALMCRGIGLEWYSSLLFVFLGIRASVRTDTKTSAAQTTLSPTLFGGIFE